VSTEFSLPKRLVEVRKSQNFSQVEVAKMIGLPERSYRRYESGEREPVISSIIALARLYGVSTDYLLGLKDTP